VGSFHTMADNYNALSLEDVFVQRAPASSPGRCKIKLTPRSRKAVLIHGIDPLVLRDREYASFFLRGQDPEIQTMKYDLYSRTREKLYQLALDARSKLAAKANARNDSFSSTNDSVSTVSKTPMATHIDRKEQVLIEQVRNRQQKEIIRMLAFEKKNKEIMDKMSAKTEEQAGKDEQRKKEKRKRELQALEEARLRELRRKAREDAEASLARMQMQEQTERERKIREKKIREEREIKKRAVMEEQQRIRKRKAHQQQTKKDK